MTPEPTVVPRFDQVLRRHVQDAAFYWRQQDSSLQSVQLTPDRLDEFSLQMHAHLDGLLQAKREGWDCALEAFERWRQAGETFVITWLAAQIDHGSLWEKVWPVVQANPDGLIRGAVSALAWLPTERATLLMRRWCAEAESPIRTVIALRAAALTDVPVQALSDQPLAAWLGHVDPHVRASACRWAAIAGHHPEPVEGALHQCLNSDDRRVRAEAAITLALRGEGSDVALSALWRSVTEQLNDLQTATGWHQKQGWRRLNRWLAHLGHAAPRGHRGIAVLLRQLPSRAALRVALHHGDPACLDYVLGQLDEPENQRLAGWIWQTLTGWDLELNGLTALDSEDETSRGLEVPTGQSAFDVGLPTPDVAAIRRLHAELAIEIPDDARLLQGEAVSLALVAEILADAPQAVRHVAALALDYGAPEHPFHVRAPMWKQRHVIRSLRQAAET
ncbi:HEAT repeat domain-containing protein [Roseateles depolymerans]|uniref:Uncharacterized protein n=1 Tax=Roseateles depolymerans TaxID=76731 RepID=A0A0U3MZG0_9BURK|nr:HEAT repeat domain-containing protein [Roseateles depolymerans]ALV05355.1 hypothetical protein RD2015_859 [Roseateles depolymerans]REG14629.1 hypothetical protein DES44_3125 [Roseateles depolymerans]